MVGTDEPHDESEVQILKESKLSNLTICIDRGLNVRKAFFT